MGMRLGALLVAVVAVAAACTGDDGGGEAADRGGETSPAGEAAEEGRERRDGQGGDRRQRAPVPSAGCDGGALEPADLAEATLTVGGAERRWLLSAPAWDDGDDPLPLVVDFHGLAEGADVHARMTQLGPLGTEEGYVTVFPHGTGSPVLWDVDPVIANNADLAFVDALLDRVGEERCIDTARVYATGLSNGAMMASVVACSLSDRFAAIAPVAGIQLPEGCDPRHPMPVLAFHGTADPILLFNGGVNADALGPVLGGGGEAGATTTTTQPPVDLEGEGYPETVRGWAELVGCEDAFEDERVSETVIRRIYDCPDEAPVEFVIVEGGGHSWPSSEFSRSIEQIVGPTTFDIDASREMLDFFRRFSLPPA